jgi:hypothetical protein
MTPHYVSQGGELNWLLDDLVNRVPQVTKAVMLTQDGLAIGAPTARADGPGADGVPVDATAAADPPATRRALGKLRVQRLSDDGRSIRSGSVRGVVA